MAKFYEAVSLAAELEYDYVAILRMDPRVTRRMFVNMIKRAVLAWRPN